MATLTGLEAKRPSADKVVFSTRTGTLVLAVPAAFAAAFGEAPPHPEDGPHLAGFTIGCRDLSRLAARGLQKVGDRLVIPASRNFGAALAFAAV
jgi:hypothetical protein